MVEITRMPQTQGVVIGFIDAAGEIVPVISVRRCLGVAERETRLTDRLIIACAAGRKVALAVDAVQGVMEPSGRDMFTAMDVSPQLGGIEGVVRFGDALVMIEDLSVFLALEQTGGRDAALRREDSAARGGES
jgi:purine-binding chemotaxis protein CheW